MKSVVEITYPDYWDPQVNDHQLFTVAKDSAEWDKVSSLFHKTSGGAKLSKITRNQNRDLYQWYLLKKAAIAKKNKGIANELLLFHGSRAGAYKIILEQGLDHRVAKDSGAIGVGIYFATNSATSMGYTGGKQSGKQKMLLCKVICGSSTNGKHGLRRPPEKNKGILYDSVTNGGKSVYVVFDNNQAYPEYLIEF